MENMLEISRKIVEFSLENCGILAGSNFKVAFSISYTDITEIVYHIKGFVITSLVEYHPLSANRQAYS